VKNLLSALALLASATASAAELVEISAPIFPKVLVLYAGEGTNYPSTQPARETLVANSALTYSTLLNTCASQPQYAAIALQTPANPALSALQLSTNYQLYGDPVPEVDSQSLGNPPAARVEGRT